VIIWAWHCSESEISAKRKSFLIINVLIVMIIILFPHSTYRAK